MASVFVHLRQSTLPHGPLPLITKSSNSYSLSNHFLARLKFRRSRNIYHNLASHSTLPLESPSPALWHLHTSLPLSTTNVDSVPRMALHNSQSVGYNIDKYSEVYVIFYSVCTLSNYNKNELICQEVYL